MLLEVEGVSVQFGRQRAVDRVSLSLVRANFAYVLWRAVVPMALGVAPLLRTPGVVWTAAIAAGAAVVVAAVSVARA